MCPRRPKTQPKPPIASQHANEKPLGNLVSYRGVLIRVRDCKGCALPAELSARASNLTGFRDGRQHAQYVSGRAVLCRALGHLAVLALRYTSGVRVLGIRYFSSPSYTHSRHWRLERREIRLPRRPGLSALLSRAIDYLRSLAICPALSVHDRWPARHPEALRPDVISRTMSIAPGTAATAPDAPTNP